nr:hypothetical protein [Mycoplasmopsis bovis]
MIKIIKIISTDDEIKKIKKDKFKETVTKIKNSFGFKVSNKVIMSLLKIKKSTYYKKLKKLKMIKEKNHWIREHCSSSYLKKLEAFSADERLVCLYYAKINK